MRIISRFISLKQKRTKNLISTKQIEMMKDGVRIINCARGGVVDEDALAKALESGKVAGAALDVYDVEPLAEDSALSRYGQLYYDAAFRRINV